MVEVTVKMDINEYNSLMESKMLLTESLAREKELQESISKIEQEKADIIESAKMKIVHKNIVQTRMILTEPHLNVDEPDLVDNMRLLAYNVSRGNPDVKSLLQRIFIYKSDTKYSDEPDHGSVNFIGLDEAKEEIRKELLSEYKTDEIMRELHECQAKFRQKTSELSSVYSELDRVRKERNESDEEASSLRNALIRRVRENTELLHMRIALLRIETILAENSGICGIFSRKEAIDEITKVIKDVKLNDLQENTNG